MTEHAYSQIPVTADGRLVGSVNEGHLYSGIVKNPEIMHGPVEAIMQPAIPFADISTSVDALAADVDAREPGRAGTRFQTRPDVHHHAMGHHQGSSSLADPARPVPRLVPRCPVSAKIRHRQFRGPATAARSPKGPRR